MKNEARVVINLSDDNLKECKISYFYDDELLDIDELNRKFRYNEFLDTNKDYVYRSQFSRFMSCYINTENINRSVCDKEIYNDLGTYVETLPISIPTNHLISGFVSMHHFSINMGGFTKTYIKYKEDEHIIAQYRSGPFNEYALKLIFKFLTNNEIKLEDMNCDEMTYENFLICLFTYDINMVYPKYDKEKIKEMIKKKEISIISRKINS